MAVLKPGAKAPDFELPTGDGGTLSLAALRGKKVVLFFYPKDDTPGCTREACSFQENLRRITGKGAAVVGVSVDPAASHAKFAEKYGLTFPLVSDAKQQIVKKYGVWKEKSMYGKTYMGTERTTFIIDATGVVTHIFPKVKVDGHVDEVLAALAS